MSSVKDRKSRQTVKFESRREEILRAAAILFNRKGVRGTSLAEIAEAVGLGTNSVTYYYRRKDDLAAACLLRSLQIYDALIDQAGRASTPNERVAELVRAFFTFLAEVAVGVHPEPVGFHDTRSLIGAQWEEVSTSYGRMFRRIRGLMADAVQDRQVLNARTHLLISVLHSMRLLVADYDADDYPRIAEDVVDILLRGIASTEQAKIDSAEVERAAIALEGRTAEGPEGFLRTATMLINEQGYRGASVDKISSHLNVTKGAFYHHNENKGDLVADCFQRTFSIIRIAQRQAAAERSGLAKLVYCVLVLARFQLSESGPLLRRTALAALPSELRQEIQMSGNRVTNRLTGFIVDGMRDGSVRVVNPAIAAHLLNELVNSVSDLPHWVQDITGSSIEKLFACSLLNRGILAG